MKTAPIQQMLDFNTEPIKELPWLYFFPEWMPEAGGLACIDAVFIPGYGYSYGDVVRITAISGTDVEFTCEHRLDKDFWKNGKKGKCPIHDLWPVCGIHF